MYEAANCIPVALSDVSPRLGIGYCSGHFGELLQGAFTEPAGSIVRGLVTLPYPTAGVMAHVTAARGSGKIHAAFGKSKTVNLVRGYLQLHGLASRVDCAVQLSSRLVEGVGMGSSTADLVATVRALDLALSLRTDDATVARLAVKTEVACDSTMFVTRALLFAQREGRVLEDFGPPLPRMELVGFNLAPNETFPTAETPPASYSPDEIGMFDELRILMRRAVGARNVATLAEVATASARINQRHFPKPRFADFLQLASDFRAQGVSVAHSGTLGALIYDAKKPCASAQLIGLKAAALATGYEPISVFRT